MKIYTHYSDSHEVLYRDYFKKSIYNLYSKDELQIRSVKHKQTTINGVFMEHGWEEAMKFKLQVIIQAIHENKNSNFIFSDVDIVFHNKFVDDLLNSIQDNDIICQEDRGTLCAGFFMAKGNERVLELFTRIYNTFTELVNDQVALNHYKDMVKYQLLDTEKYYTIGNYFNNENGTHVWDNITSITPPKKILMHHANYVLGVDNKLKLLNMIKTNIQP